MLDTKKITLQLIEPQIIRMTVSEGIELEQKDAQQAIAEAMELSKGKGYAILFNANVSGNISFEAREEFARSKKRVAVAIVTDLLANKLLGNFFIKFHKPSSSSHIFSDEESALAWLRKQITASKADTALYK